MRYLALCLLLFVITGPSYAQEADCSLPAFGDYCLSEWGGHLEYLGGVILGWSSGLGFVQYPSGQFSLLGGNGERYVRLTGHCTSNSSLLEYVVTIPEDRVPVRIEAYKQSAAAGSVSRAVAIRSRPVPDTGDYTTHAITSGAFQVNQQAVFTNTGQIQAGYQLSIYASNFCNSSSAYVQLAVTLVYEESAVQETQYSLPLREIEDAPSPVHRASYYDANTSDVLERRPFYHYSEIPGALVFPAAAGTITGLEVIAPPDPFGPGAECAQIPNLAANLSDACAVYRDGATNGGLPIYWRSMMDNPPTLWRVTLATEDYNFEYILKNADEFVYLGQEVGPNCAIGQTTEYFYQRVGIGLDLGWPPVGLGFEFVRSEDGVVMVNAVDSEGLNVDLLDQFTLRPTGNSPCNVPPGYEACFGDATLSRPGLFNATSGAEFLPEGGVRLAPGASITSNPPLLIEEDQNPGVRAVARTLGGPGSLRIRLGSGQNTTALSSQWADTQLLSGGYEPDLITLYTFSLSNPGDSTVEVREACIQYTTGPGGEGEPDNPAPVPPACYFANNSFNNSTGSWSVSSAIDGGEGQIYSASGGEIWQSVALYPDGGPTSYTVTVTAALWYYDSYAPNPDNTDEGVTVEYLWPSSADWEEIGGTATYGAFAQNGNVISFSETFTVTDTTQGEWRFRFTLTNAPAGVRGIAIRDVCINAGAGFNPGEIWPPPPEGWGPPPPPFNASCSLAEAPAGGDGVGAWIDWLWRRLNSFFQCDLMLILNSIHEAIVTFWRAVGFGLRWTIASFAQFWGWADESLFPWAEGHLANLSNSGPVTYTESCDNIWCFLTNFFSAIQSLLDLITTITGPFFDFFFGILRTLVDFALRLVNWVLLISTEVFVNFSSGDVPEGVQIPACNPEEPDQNGFCIVNWILANSIFNPTKAPFNLIIPLLISFGSIKWLLWMVREIKNTIREAGQAI